MKIKIPRHQVEEIIPLCDDLDFVNRFLSKLNPRIVKIIMFRHGHTVYGKLNFTDIAPHIKRLAPNNDEILSGKQISILYYRGLGKIKEMMEMKNV
tara:strand:- start:15 stop:302 length:288 start_codon:yes stop_codon:yes gene_type:complete